MSNICVIGAGHVGLITAGTLAELGHVVACCDVSEQRIAQLQLGEATIVEAGLPELLAAQQGAGRLSYSMVTPAAVKGSEFIFLCVPTPPGPEGRPDLSAVIDCARTIASDLTPGSVVVTKSTAPVGSTLVVEANLHRNDVAVVSNPEFLREACAVTDSRSPQRIVIGSDDKQAAARVASLFRSVDAPIVFTDPASAEVIKYAANAFLAMKVSYANSIALLCGRLGADVDDVLLGIGYDSRIGFAAMSPGPGWGGSCLPKDTAALLCTARDYGFEFSLLDAAIEVNEQQRHRIVHAIRNAVGGDLRQSSVAVLGLTFKAGTEDLRDSPATRLIGELCREGASVRAYDPTVHSLDDCVICADPYSAADGSHVLVVMTEWEEFRWLDYKKIAEVMEQRVIIDARRLLDGGSLRRAGITHIGIEDL